VHQDLSFAPEWKKNRTTNLRLLFLISHSHRHYMQVFIEHYIGAQRWPFSGLGEQ
jgi:hypothetical protein